MLKRSLSGLILLTVLMLVSCANGSNGAAGTVPLVTDKLTFIYFYSDECPNCMIMQPIVERLESQYKQQMTFESLNVDSDGKNLYNALGLHGNPIFMIMGAGGDVVYRGFGRVPEVALDSGIRKAIGL